MSANLMWKPIRPEGKGLSDAAKFFFRDAYSLNEGPITLSENDVRYLQGAAAATKDKDLKSDITKLLEAIGKFGQVELWQEF